MVPASEVPDEPTLHAWRYLAFCAKITPGESDHQIPDKPTPPARSQEPLTPPDSITEAYDKVVKCMRTAASESNYREAASKLCTLLGITNHQPASFEAIKATISLHISPERFRSNREARDGYGVSTSAFKAWKARLRPFQHNYPPSDQDATPMLPTSTSKATG